MFGIIISVIVLITMGYLILKNYKPQVLLAAAGIFLMMCGVWLGARWCTRSRQKQRLLDRRYL